MKIRSKKMKIMIFDEPQEHRGFNFKEGFAALLNSSGIPVAATSGRERKGNLLYVYRYVYRPAEDGRWDGRWESEETFPVQLVLEAIRNWRDA
jgi:hypothetical protein